MGSLAQCIYLDHPPPKYGRLHDEVQRVHPLPPPPPPLRYAYMIKCTGFTKDPVTGRVVEVQAEADLAPAGKKPPKGILNWVAQPTPGQEPERAEVREEGRKSCLLLAALMMHNQYAECGFLSTLIAAIPCWRRLYFTRHPPPHSCYTSRHGYTTTCSGARTRAPLRLGWRT